jgi:hypothetical protein
MLIPGRRVRRTRLVQTPRYIVAVEVDAVIPDADSGEPCYEPETVQFLREVAERAEQGDLDWLRRHGKVYAAT